VVRGRVVADDTGAAIADASVTLLSGATPAVQPGGPAARVEADGAFEIAGIPPGLYRLVVTPGAAALRYVQARHPDPASDNPRALTLAAGQVVDDVVVRLPRAAAIAGRVVDVRGEPLALVDISVFQHMPGGRLLPIRTTIFSSAARSDDQGLFRVFGLRPGAYVVAATPAPAISGGRAAASRCRSGTTSTAC
jgi:hypothetical protein